MSRTLKKVLYTASRVLGLAFIIFGGERLGVSETFWSYILAFGAISVGCFIMWIGLVDREDHDRLKERCEWFEDKDVK